MSTFAVVLENLESPPPEKLSALFQMLLGYSKFDANQRATRVRGIVAEDLNAEVAQKLQFALGNLKFPARIMPQANVPDIIRGRRVQKLVIEPEQLGVRWTLTGQVQFYPWSAVKVISAAVVFHTSSEQYLETQTDWDMLSNRPYLYEKTAVKNRDTSRDVAMAGVTLQTPSGLETMRLRAPELEYATMLGEENVRPAPLTNFCLVLARLGMNASAAHITEETVELISAANASPRLPRSPRFESEEKFDAYQRWLVAKGGGYLPFSDSGPARAVR